MRGLFVAIGIAEAALVTFLPLFLADRGLTPAAIGVALSLMSATALLAGPVWGGLADRRPGSRRSLAASAVATAAVALALLVHGPAVRIAAVVVVLGAVRTGMGPIGDAMALESLGAGRRSEYGRIRLWMSASFALAALVWGAVLQALGYAVMPLAYAAGLTLVVAWALHGLGRRARGLTPPESRPRGRLLGLLAEPQLLGFLVALLLVNAAFNASWNFLALRISALGGGALLVGLAACLQAAAEIPFMYWSGRISRAVHDSGLFAIGCLVYAASFAAWGVLSSPAAIVVVKIAVGFGFALVYVGSVVIVDDIVPTHRRATGQALSKAFAFGLAPILGSAVGGFVYGHVGPRALFFLAAGAAATAAALAWTVLATRRRERDVVTDSLGG